MRQCRFCGSIKIVYAGIDDCEEEWFCNNCQQYLGKDDIFSPDEVI